MARPVKRKRGKLDQATGPRAGGRLIIFDLEATCWESNDTADAEILEFGAVMLAVDGGQPAASRHGVDAKGVKSARPAAIDVAAAAGGERPRSTPSAEDAAAADGDHPQTKAPREEPGAVASQQARQPAEFGEVVRTTAALSDFCRALVPITQWEADAADPFPVVFARFMEWAGPQPFWLAAWGNFDRALMEAERRRYGLRMPATFRAYIDLRREFARINQVRPPGLRAAMEASGLAMEGPSHRALDDARNLARLTRILVQERRHARGRR